MSEDSESRVARNESIAREINEAIEHGRGPADVQAPIAFRCECGRFGCNVNRLGSLVNRLGNLGRRFIAALRPCFEPLELRLDFAAAVGYGWLGSVLS